MAGKAHVMLCVTILGSSSMSVGAQANKEAYIESLTCDEVIAGLTANVNRVRTYRAAFVVCNVGGGVAERYTVGWERVPGSGEGLHDKRFYKIGPESDSEVLTSGNYAETHIAFNGEKGFLCSTRHKREKTSIGGHILPGLDGRMVGLGLTVAALSTHFTDSAPVQRVLANGTFVREGTEMVNGRRCVAIYGENGYAEPGPWQVKRGPGEYVKLFIDPFAGFMPVRQEWYAVKEVEGKLVRKLGMVYTAQFVEHEGGIWFPIAGSYEWQHVKKVLSVKECSLNVDIPQEDFAITSWPPGTHVEDQVANVSFWVPRAVPDKLSGLLDVDAVPEERVRQFEEIQKGLTVKETDVVTDDTHAPKGVPHGRETHWSTRIVPSAWIYAKLGAVCLSVGAAFFGLGRSISRKRNIKKRVES